MTARRVAGDAAACAALGVGLATMASAAVRARGRRAGPAIVVAQALSPRGTVVIAAAVAHAVVRRRRRLGLASAAAAGAAVANARWIRGRRIGRVVARADRPLTVAHANLLFSNWKLRHGIGALVDADVDVLTFSELTPSHLRTLGASALAERYPYRIERPNSYASGAGLWSRYPLVERDAPGLTNAAIVADVDVPGHGAVRIDVIHTRSPLHHFPDWHADFERLARWPAPNDQPAVMVGDFNAGWGHPEYRALTRLGWRDAHRDLARGLGVSWPINRTLPAFVRLDHALVNGRVAVVDTRDVEVTDSDHSCVVVSVHPLP